MNNFQRIPLAKLVLDSKVRVSRDNDYVWNLNLDQIESDSGRVLKKVNIPINKLGPSTYPFTAGTVLYSKLRPYLNKVVVADEDGYATTELVPLRCDPEKISSLYLAYFLRSAEFLNFANTVVAGAKMPRMVMSEFWRYEVPTPPLDEQLRIVAILDKADALRTKRREALAQLDRLAQSIFVEMFGDFKQDLHRWPIEPLGEVSVDMKIGLVRSSEEFGDDAKFDIPYVRMNAIGRCGDFFPDLVQRTTVTPKELSDYRLQMGDILFNTRNSKELVGKTAIFRGTGNYVYNNNLMRIRFDQRVNAEYAAHCFLTPFIQQELEMRKSGTTSVFAIYGRDLSTLPLPIPPASLQKKFASRVACIQKMRTRIQISASETTRLFASLQHHAFQGEL